MKKIIVFVATLLIAVSAFTQSVGIGTNTPNSSSSLDLGPSSKPLIVPRLNTTQMNAVTNNVPGMLIFNTDQQQLYGYTKQGYTAGQQPVYNWLPMTVGPRMLAWGIIDSFGVQVNTSNNFTVLYDELNHLYSLTLNGIVYDRDSMIVMVTPIANGTWSQTVSVGQNILDPLRPITIKFVDVFRVAFGVDTYNTSRRSWFSFVVYNLKKDPF